MAAAIGFAEVARAPGRLVVRAETVRRTVLWLMVFGGSITMIEPSPYEVFGIVAIAVFASSGLKLSREMVPILLLVIVYLVGALITLSTVLHLPRTLMWTATGWYLGATGLFFMMILTEQTLERLDVIVRAYVLTAVSCSAIGTLAYAGLLPGSDALLLYGRVKSTFEDPNVFGPFLVLPAVILVQRLYLFGWRGQIRTAGALSIILTGLFLSFSRGAWGHLLMSAGLMTAATVWCARSRQLRGRILLVCLAGAACAALLLMLLLSFDAVRTLFDERATLEQSYDAGQFGRFNRHWLGFVLALDHPVGIGMLQFGPMFGEDTHNSYLNAFMSYGWIGGVTWPAIVLSTLVVGWRHCVVASPWRHLFICIMATYQVMVAEAWVIDIDHWRHGWLLFGVVWGLSIATARLGATASAPGEPFLASTPHPQPAEAG